jgi:hypothetical protein
MAGAGAGVPPPNRLGVRNLTLHGLLEAFTTDAGMRLTLAASSGDEIPFEVVPSDPAPARGARAGRQPGRMPLYCYRPLTADFIRERLGLLVALPTYAPAARALEGVGGTDAYLQARGEHEIPDTPRGLADTALRLFLWRIFEERSEFGFDDARFEIAYQELERAIYRGRCVTEMVAPLLGIDLDPETEELALGDGLSIVRPQSLGTAPVEVAKLEQPPLLLVLRVAHERAQPPAVAFARARFRAALTALRLYEKGSYAIGMIGYSRVDDGVWSPVALGSTGRPRLLTLIPAASEDELRGFCNLVSRRLPGASGTRTPDNSGAGEIAWALARFEMGSERPAAFEALTDYLMALRALLEPEGPSSGRLAQRLAVICAPPEERAVLAERIAEAVALERAVIAGLAPAGHSVERLVEEVGEHLRAVLRDVLCGHLAADVRGIADELLSEAAAA